MFAAVAAHGTIVGTAREIALIEFFRGLVPRRYEVLSGSVAAERDGRLFKSSNQLDVLVVDTLDYPTLLRTGDLAVVLAPSVLAIVEAKSDLERGEKFEEAMTQISQAKQVAGSETLTALFCFGSPMHSETLRGWLEDIVTTRRKRLDEARIAAPSDKSGLCSSASNFSAAYLPDLVLSDAGAVAIRHEVEGKTRYKFYSTKDGAPTIVALASKVLARVSCGLSKDPEGDPKAAGLASSFKILMDHFDAGLVESGDDDLDVTDDPPGQTE